MKKITLEKFQKENITIFSTVTVGFIVMQLLSSLGMLGSAVQGYLVPVCVYIVLAVSLNLLVGVCGELSLGHAGFMGIGAFTGITACVLLQSAIPNPVLRLVIAMILGGIMAGIFGVIIGIPALRLRGDYLAIVTLACGEILKNVYSNIYAGVDADGFHLSFRAGAFTLGEGGKMILDGPVGATGITKLASFPVGFALILFTLFVVLNLINSKEGRAIKAVRDNRIAAESVGINVTAFRMKAFVVSAVLAGMAGALFGLNFSSLTASKFNFNTSINILVFVVLGGMGNILGSIISATILYVLPEALRALDDLRMILYAVVLIVVMLCTWSPKVKDFLAVAEDKLFGKLKKMLGKKEVSTDE